MRRQVEDWHPAGIQVTGERKLKIESGKGNRKYSIALRCLYLYLCLLGTLLTLRQDLELEFHLIPVAGVLLIFALLAVLKNIWRIRGKQLYVAGYLVLLVVSGINWKHLAAGYQITENGIRHQLSSYYGVTLAEKTVMMSGGRSELVWILFFALFFWSMETVVIRKGRIGLLVASEILICLLELLCGCRFRHPGIFLVAGSLLALLAMSQKSGLMNQRILSRAGMWAGGMIICLSVVAGLAGPVLADQTKEWNQWLYQNIQEKTNKLSRALQSQNGFFGNHNPTADGSLNNYPVDQNEETDLIVHSSGKPIHNIYLHGFTGGTYQGDYWSPVERKDFMTAFPEADSGWQIQNILYRYIRSRSEEAEGTITVTRKNPGGDYGYIPYGFQVPDDENVQGDSCYASAEDTISYKGYINWTEWMDPQPSQVAESETEQRYQQYAAKEYLKVPVEGLERLRTYCEKQNLQSVQEVIDFVEKDVQEGRTYSMDLEPVPDDKDFAEYFFFDQKKGYCIHYATTATLMLRLLGVPARYVTGYVATPESFSEDQNGGYTAQITDTQAHAWVEVYRAGKGWIPLEVTPGYQEHSGAGEDETGESQEETGSTTTATVTPEPTEKPAEEQTPENITLQPTAEASSKPEELQTVRETAATPALWRILTGVLIFGILAAGSAGAVVFRRKQIIRKRNHRFFQTNINDGIRQISYAIYRMLQDGKEAGILPEVTECGEDLVFARQIEKQIPWMEKGAYCRIIEIAQQASFGPDQRTKEEREQCYEFYEKLGKWMWTQMPGQKKFRWKYMKGYEVS